MRGCSILDCKSGTERIEDENVTFHSVEYGRMTYVIQMMMMFILYVYVVTKMPQIVKPEDDDNARRAQPVYVIARPAYTATRSNHDPHRNYFKTVAPVAPPSFRSEPVPNRVPQPKARAVVFKPTQDFKPKPGALYGEYKCRCGYFWTSRLSWRDRYQECKRCHAQVRPKNQRELRPSDFKRGDDNERLDHPQHLCEMCKQVGGYCGRYK